MRKLTAADYVALPWEWRGPVLVSDASGTWYEVRIAELPDFMVAEATAETARAAVGEALEAFIDSYLSAGEDPPLPRAMKAPPAPAQMEILAA